MAKLDIGVGEEFPLEEPKREADCRRGARHHHHHTGWHERWHRFFKRSDKTPPPGTEKNEQDNKE